MTFTSFKRFGSIGFDFFVGGVVPVPVPDCVVVDGGIVSGVNLKFTFRNMFKYLSSLSNSLFK